MRIAQVLSRGASEYEKKSARIDYDLLRAEHVFVTSDADITLDYRNLDLPEAVEERYFFTTKGTEGTKKTVGSFNRRGVRKIVEATVPRLHRTREDIDWLLLDGPPQDFDAFDVWVDPAIDDDDYDGFVAEALVAGEIVVASRTPINVKRLEKGRIGFLVPPGDANELTHAILAALFKPEIALQKIEAARQTISKFHPRQRLRALRQLLAGARS